MKRNEWATVVTVVYKYLIEFAFVGSIYFSVWLDNYGFSFGMTFHASNMTHESYVNMKNRNYYVHGTIVTLVHPWALTSSVDNITQSVTDDICRSWWRHQMETFPRRCSFARGTIGHRSFSSICTRTNGWVNNRDAVDSRRYFGHYDVTVVHNIDQAPGLNDRYVKG